MARLSAPHEAGKGRIKPRKARKTRKNTKEGEEGEPRINTNVVQILV